MNEKMEEVNEIFQDSAAISQEIQYQEEQISEIIKSQSSDILGINTILIFGVQLQINLLNEYISL